MRKLASRVNDKYSAYGSFINRIVCSRQHSSTSIQLSVYLMVFGALIASSGDLTFNWFGYTFLSINNLCTAAQGVMIKKKLVNKVDQKSYDAHRMIPIDCFYLGYQSEWSIIL
jgi:hypothetical protein